MIDALKTVLEFRAKVATKVAKKLQNGEAISHLIYGVAIFTETHGEVTFYSVAALCVGVASITNLVIGEGE